jgi:hypothetical protein
VHGLPFARPLEGYARWDAAWYIRIVQRGYYYDGPHHQSAVAFFPAYPAAIRLVNVVIGDVMISGILVTIASAAVAVVLFHRWVAGRFDTATATLAVVLMLSWPYAYYLFGAIYSDALFIAFAIGAFLLLEKGHPWIAALIGAGATAARPVGLAVTAGLLLRSLERDGVLTARLRLDLSRVRLATLAPAASIGGLVAYCAYLWWRFTKPFAFTIVSSAPGWNRRFGPRTFAKFGYAHILAERQFTVQVLTLTVSAILTIGAIVLLPAIYRRLGPGYAAYTALSIGLPFATSPEFLGMGRYMLAAFPCIAVGASLLRERPVFLARAVTALSLLLLVIFATLFIRGYYLA